MPGRLAAGWVLPGGWPAEDAGGPTSTPHLHPLPGGHGPGALRASPGALARRELLGSPHDHGELDPLAGAVMPRGGEEVLFEHPG